jgi:hypothetical protein
MRLDDVFDQGLGALTSCRWVLTSIVVIAKVRFMFRSGD